MLREHTSGSETMSETQDEGMDEGNRFGSNQDEGSCAGDGLLDELLCVSLSGRLAYAYMHAGFDYL